MDEMANAVARSGKHQSVFLRNRSQIGMVIRIFVIHVHQIMIHIADGKLRFDPLDTQALKRDVAQHAQRILGQGLIHVKRDFFSCRHRSGNQMRRQNLPRDIHERSPPFRLAHTHGTKPPALQISLSRSVIAALAVISQLRVILRTVTRSPAASCSLTCGMHSLSPCSIQSRSSARSNTSGRTP